MRGLEHLPCAERSWEGGARGLFGLEKRRLQGGYPAAAHCLKGSIKELERDLFTWLCGVRTRG